MEPVGRIQAFAKQHKLKDAHALQAYFNQRIQKILEAHGKIMIGWDEILDPDLPPSIVIQSWRGQQSLADAAKQGRRGILSWGYYLDYLRPASYHYGIDPPSGANVLGGEACMWAEYVNAETVDSRIWPRAAAIAERLWSPQEITDVDSMYARLEVVSRTLEWTGVQHRANYGPMLDRLTGGRPSESLRVLADVSEAQGLSGRSRAAKYTSLTPLNRFVDAVRPESESVRRLGASGAPGDSRRLGSAAGAVHGMGGERRALSCIGRVEAAVAGSIGARRHGTAHSGLPCRQPEGSRGLGSGADPRADADGKAGCRSDSRGGAAGEAAAE